MERRRKCWQALTRRRIQSISLSETPLKRVLTLVDLVALALGTTLGLGIYVLAGQVAYDIAGPGVVISFLLAGMASLFSGLCFAEFAARIPTAGSAYVYSYATVGEFIAFFIGWNLVLEYMIGTASLAKGMSGYLDSGLFAKKMSYTLRQAMPIDWPYLAPYPDILASCLVLAATVLLCLGVKESTMANNVFTIINLATICIIVCCGAVYAKVRNWSIPEHEVPAGFGEGGFLPFGMAGVWFGAARCFFGMVGFDCVAAAGEEAKNPKRDAPLAIFISLTIITVAYVSISIVLTMMLEYYKLDPSAPFPHAFDAYDQRVIGWIIAIGAVFALCCSILGCFFALPRVLYAMAVDGLLFQIFAKVNSRTKTPLRGTIIGGLASATMCLIFKLHVLVDMMSIATLVTYTIVSVCVIILRYEDPVMGKPAYVTPRILLNQLFKRNSLQTPDHLSSRIVKFCTAFYIGVCSIWCVSTRIIKISSLTGFWLTMICGGMAIILMVIIALQPKTLIELRFKVEPIPLIPCLAISINLFLIYQLSPATWLRFAIWMFLGYIIYFAYGIHHSTLNLAKDDEEK